MDLRLRLLLVASLGSTLTPAPSWGVDCAFRALELDSRVVRDSGESLDPAQWLTDHRCEKLRTSVGRIQVVFQTDDGRTVKSEVVPRARLVASGDGKASRAFDEIRSMLAGDERARAGRSRSGGALFDAVDAAMPRGNVVRPDGPTLDIRLPLVADEVGSTFVLTHDRVLVYQAKVAGPILAIPTQLLVVGTSYVWSFRTPSESANGTFKVVGPDALQATLAEADREAPDATIARAETLIRAGYPQAARDLLRQWLER